MALIRITRRTDLPPDEAWRRLTRWERHADHVPLTRIRVTTPPPERAGTRFTARTGVGRVAFDDPMEVVVWEPPGEGRRGLCRVVKRGPHITGWTELEVRPDPGGCAIEWREDLRVAGLPRSFDSLTALSARVVFRRAVTGLLRDA